MRFTIQNIMTLFVVVALATSFLCGVYGYNVEMRLPLDDAVYKTLVLYVLGCDLADIPVRSIFINIARFLAPISFISGGTQFLLYLSNNGFTRFKRGCYRNHFVVFGNGSVTRHLVDILREEMSATGRNHQIVVVGDIEDSAKIDVVKECLLSSDILSMLRLHKTQKIFILYEEDFKCLKTVDTICRYLNPEYSNISQSDLNHKIRNVKILMRCNSNETEGVAQEIYRHKFGKFATFKVVEEAVNFLPPIVDKTIVVLGLGELGRNIIEKYKHKNKIIGIDPDRKKIKYLTRTKSSASDVKFLEGNMEDVNPAEITEQHENMAYFVCGGDDMMRFRTALRWKRIVPQSEGTIMSVSLATNFFVTKQRGISTFNYRRIAMENVLSKPNDILVSVIVPAYNASQFISECLESLKSQDMCRLEFILVNDGSSDETLSIMQRYAAVDKRFRVIDIPHSGVGCARNVGVEKAQGKYVAFVDADDKVTSTMFEIMYRAAIESDVDVVVCRALSIDVESKQGKPIKCWNFKSGVFEKRQIEKLDFLNNICSPVLWDKIIKRDIAKRCLSPKLKRGQDFLTLISIIHMASKIRIIEDELYYYRHHEGSNMATPISKETIEADLTTEKAALLLIHKYWRNYPIEAKYIQRSKEQWLDIRKQLSGHRELISLIEQKIPEELR